MRKKNKAIEEKSVLASIRVLLLVLVVLTVGLLLVGSMIGGRFGALHQLTLDFIGPLQGGVSWVIDGGRTLKNDYIALWSVREENKRLQAQNEKYLAELAEYREGYSIYLHLQELLAKRITWSKSIVDSEA